MGVIEALAGTKRALAKVTLKRVRDEGSRIPIML
jgi:hypothetical protein